MINSSIIFDCSSVRYEGNPINIGEISLCTDSRSFKKGECFIVLYGENFNGINFVEDVVSKGSPLVVYSQTKENQKVIDGVLSKFDQTLFLPVTDTFKFLQELASGHVKELGIKNIIGITGANGKTTNKELLYHLFEALVPGKTITNEKNNNNHLGVPLTLLRATKETKYLIVEMGSNHPGEIQTLCETACPTSGYVTNIGRAHLEFFGSVDEVFVEESSLHRYVVTTNQPGPFLINTLDEHLVKLEKTSSCFTFGTDESSDIKIELLKPGIKLEIDSETYEIRNPNMSGDYNDINLGLSFSLALKYFPDKSKELLKAASTFTPRNNRSVWIEENGKSYFLDAYNANPDSMINALRGFRSVCDQKGLKSDEVLIVLGDMNELGPNSKLFHQEVGEELNKLSFEHAIFVGRFSSHYASTFQGQCFEVNSSKDLKSSKWEDYVASHKFFFLKGSRTLQLETLLDIT